MGWHQTKLSGWALGVSEIHSKQQMTGIQGDEFFKAPIAKPLPKTEKNVFVRDVRS